MILIHTTQITPLHSPIATTADDPSSKTPRLHKQPPPIAVHTNKSPTSSLFNVSSGSTASCAFWLRVSNLACLSWARSCTDRFSLAFRDCSTGVETQFFGSSQLFWEEDFKIDRVETLLFPGVDVASLAEAAAPRLADAPMDDTSSSRISMLFWAALAETNFSEVRRLFVEAVGLEAAEGGSSGGR